MSGLNVVPALYDPAGNSKHFQLLLTDRRQQSQTATTGTETGTALAPVPTPLQYANSQQAYIQAQILSSELYRGHNRHSATRSAREAARAYGQARRRPQTVADMPIQYNVV
ncbi:hypothetical protein [uncultured Cohaesibacter sp.]|uniref:hypothetical protein n=1 Tax=uncultured Cohaesibacter sp. TaxID=1002546 RepID=UPI0029C7E126|nr:hypothetical protein [uncultured Cohaesibacter sp.]